MYIYSAYTVNIYIHTHTLSAIYMCVYFNLYTYFALSINLKSKYIYVSFLCVYTDRLKNKLEVKDIVCFTTKNLFYMFYKNMFTYDLVTLSFVVYSTYTISNAYSGPGTVLCYIKG